MQPKHYHDLDEVWNGSLQDSRFRREQYWRKQKEKSLFLQ